MEINTDYKQFVFDLIERNRLTEVGIPLVFEEFDVLLPPREFLLVAYSIAKHRVENKEINKLLWDFIRSYSNIEIPEFIYKFSFRNYNRLLFSTTWEEVGYKKSLATAGPKNPMFKGTIYAVNIETEEIIPMNSRFEMEELGFNPSGVYDCVNGNRYTHNGYVFVRDTEIKKPRASQRKKLGLRR